MTATFKKMLSRAIQNCINDASELPHLQWDEYLHDDLANQMADAAAAVFDAAQDGQKYFKKEGQ